MLLGNSWILHGCHGISLAKSYFSKARLGPGSENHKKKIKQHKQKHIYFVNISQLVHKCFANLKWQA